MTSVLVLLLACRSGPPAGFDAVLRVDDAAVSLNGEALGELVALCAGDGESCASLEGRLVEWRAGAAGTHLLVQAPGTLSYSYLVRLLRSADRAGFGSFHLQVGDGEPMAVEPPGDREPPLPVPIEWWIYREGASAALHATVDLSSTLPEGTCASAYARDPERVALCAAAISAPLTVALGAAEGCALVPAETEDWARGVVDGLERFDIRIERSRMVASREATMADLDRALSAMERANLGRPVLTSTEGAPPCEAVVRTGHALRDARARALGSSLRP